jgi:hypothetical protein
VHLVDGLEDVTFRYRQLVDLHCAGDETSICAPLKTSCFTGATHDSRTMEAGGGVAGINRP